jgi:hypothetical protein
MDSGLKTGLREGGWPIEDLPVAQPIPRSVPWTLDGVAFQFSFSKRSSKMSTPFPDRVKPSVLFYKENADAGNFNPMWFIFGQF